MANLLKLKKPTDLRTSLFETLEQASEGSRFLIPHKSGNSVLQSESGYEDLLEEIETLRSINRGLQDYLDGKVHTHAAVKDHLKIYAEKRKKQTRRLD